MFDYCFKCYWSVKETHDPGHRFVKEGEGPERTALLEGESESESYSDEDESEEEENNRQ